MAAYFCSFLLIIIPIIRLHQLFANKLAVATAAIFFSGSIGHGMHALDPLLSSNSGMSAGSTTSWWQAGWHLTTACVAVYYLTLRRLYGQLLVTAPLFDDLIERERVVALDDLRQGSGRALPDGERQLRDVVLRAGVGLAGAHRRHPRPGARTRLAGGRPACSGHLLPDRGVE